MGERGEEWAVAQFAILLFVAMGSVPLVGGLITLLAGPGLLAGGIGVCAAGLKGLGKSLSPWPAPIEDNELNTEGIYGMMRHPMYTGEGWFAGGGFGRVCVFLLLVPVCAGGRGDENCRLSPSLVGEFRPQGGGGGAWRFEAVIVSGM